LTKTKKFSQDRRPVFDFEDFKEYNHNLDGRKSVLDSQNSPGGRRDDELLKELLGLEEQMRKDPDTANRLLDKWYRFR